MYLNTPPRSMIRFTRRGKLVLVVTGAVVAGTAVAVPLLSLGGADRKPISLVIPEGWRASQVYEAIDKALALPAGSTAKSIGKARLKLPSDAAGNPEGYLFPATYHVDKDATPQTLLQQMVDTANDRFDVAPVAAGAQRSPMNLYQAITVASIVQAESASRTDMGKVARVVLNRLARGIPLQMDSTLNYGLRRHAARTSLADTRIDNPYNSYQRAGLPPTPIDSPGADAMRATLNPTPGDWLYFVTVKPGDTRFTTDYEEHQRNVAEFNALQQKNKKAQRSPSATASPSGASPSPSGVAQSRL
ncbi:endolytic transglycosylase MltG [Streptomyces shenzhenensis]|uniref:endolytic transglycosylase MltG n=1 Tax=Streptomyces shenzhenensis TaxID=943815 RepID=UPI0033F73EC1